MFNAQLFGTATFNSSRRRSGGSSVVDAIRFNGYSLQNAEIITQEFDSFSAPSRDLVFSDVPRGHGRSLTSDFLRTKTIKISGVIKKSSAALLEAEIDAFKKAMLKREASLDVVDAAGVSKRYTATITNADAIFTRRKGWHITFCPFDLVFVCTSPFAKATSYAQTTTPDQTTLVYTGTVENDGTAEASPIITIAFTAASSVTALSFLNSTTSQKITVTTAISAGDSIVIDCENAIVYKNGVSIDYSGIFPALDSGTNSFTMTTTGSSATYSITIRHKKAFL